MTIYILGTPQETAQALDDRSLDKMIKDVAQVLSLTYFRCYESGITTKKDFPVFSIFNKDHELWAQWARELKANYLYLVELGEALSHEYTLRSDTKTGLFSFKIHKLEKILTWARDNLPDLPMKCNSHTLYYNGTDENCKLCKETTPLPLIMPKKYIVSIRPEDIYLSYRNYYQVKLGLRHNKRPCLGTPHIFATVCSHCIWRSWWTGRSKPEWLEI